MESSCFTFYGEQIIQTTPGFTVAHFGVFEEAMRWLNTSDVEANDR